MGLADATEKEDYRYRLSELDIDNIACLEYNYYAGSEICCGFSIVTDNKYSQEILEARQETFGEEKLRLTVVIDLGSAHWVTLVISYQDKGFDGYYIDSRGNPLPEECCQYLEQVNLIDLSEGVIQQTDDHNSGLWALENAALIHKMLDENKSLDWIKENLAIERSESYFRERRKKLSEKLKNDRLRGPKQEYAENKNVKDISDPRNSIIQENGRSAHSSERQRDSLPSNQNQGKWLESKKRDLNLLYDLHKRLQDFLKRNTHSEKEIDDLLSTMSNTFSRLYRNDTDIEAIRNRYGKINYSDYGKENSRYVDFDRLSFFEKYRFESVLKRVCNIIYKNCSDFLEEFKTLKDNIEIIFKKEKELLLENNIQLSEDYWEEMGRGLIESELKDLKLLINTINIFYDSEFINEMRSVVQIDIIKPIDKGTNPSRRLYTLARILTILGEAAKNLSNSFKSNYCYLPWNALGRIRDQLAHKHHAYVVEPEENIQKIYDEIVDSGLKKFKEELDQISSDTSDLQIEAIREYSEDISKKGIPDDIRQLINDGKIPNSKKDKNLLKKRIEYLEREEKDLNNQNSRITQSIKRMKDHTDKEKSKIYLCDNKTKLKSVQDDLNVFKKIRKEIKESLSLENDSFYKLNKIFQDSKKFKTQAISKEEDKIESILVNIKKEIESLKQLIQSSEGTERDYAHEHSVAVIGQLFRDLKDCQSRQIEDIISDNLTVKESLQTTIAARNQKVMHDPFNNHTPYLTRLIQEWTLPISSDIDALATIFKNKDITMPDDSPEIEKLQKASGLVDIYHELGCAYLRLNKLREAKEYFEDALSCTSAEFHAKYIDIEGDVEIKEKVNDYQKSDYRSTQLIITKKRRCFILEVTKNVLFNRVILKHKIADCLINTGNSEEAKRSLDEAESIITKHCLDLDYSCHKLFLKVKIRAYLTDMKDVDDMDYYYNEQKEKFSKEDCESIFEISFDYIKILIKKERYEKALSVLKNIDLRTLEKTLNKNSDLLQLSVYVHTMKGCIFLIKYFIAQESKPQDPIEYTAKVFERMINNLRFGMQARERPDEELNLSNRAMKLQEAIEYIGKAYDLMSSNLPNLREKYGDYIRGVWEFIIEYLPRALGMQAHELLTSNLKEALNLSNRAVELQEKHDLDASVSYLIRARIYLNLYVENQDFSNREDYFQKSLEDFQRTVANGALKDRAAALDGLTHLYWKKGEYKEAFFYALEAKLCFSELTDSDKEDYDKRYEECVNVTLRIISDAKEGILADLLTEMSEAGNEHKRKRELEKAAFNYKKTLIGYNLLYDIYKLQGKELTETEISIKSMLLNLFECGGRKIFNEGFWEYFPNVQSIKNKLKDNTNKLFENIRSGNLEEIKCLLKDGAMVNFANNKGSTPLHVAARNNVQKDIVHILLRNGADALQVTNNTGNTALHLATLKGNGDVVEILLWHVKQTNPDKLNRFMNAQTIGKGTTALHAAVQNSYVDIVKILIYFGVNINVRNKDNKTPLDYALEKQHLSLKVTELLRENRAKTAAE